MVFWIDFKIHNPYRNPKNEYKEIIHNESLTKKKEFILYISMQNHKNQQLKLYITNQGPTI